MPRLKHLYLQGFKSFAEPVTFTFPSGITAIVGPNGSGKSNIADAIRWVLGEQRMTTMRGRTGEDMIFAGSAKRARAGMARVALTLDNAEGWFPLDFTEITIERRTYRDGRTDYILNGSKIRLADLRHLLAQAGLGRDAYLIVGQGAIDRLLVLRPRERVAIFEHAAGIAPYRLRRQEALGKLEATQRNLERVQDILAEIEPRLRRLRRHAERARRHAELTRLLQEIQRTWYDHRWGQALSALELVRQRVDDHRRRVAQLTAAAEQTAARIAETRRHLAALRHRLADLHRRSSERHTEAERRQRDLAVNRERQRQLQARRDEHHARLIPLRATLQAARAEVADLEATVEVLEARCDKARARLAEVEAAHRDLEARHRARRQPLETSQARLLDIRRRIAERQSRREQLREREAQLTQRLAALESAAAEAQEKRETLRAAATKARHAVETIAADIETAQAEEARLQTDIAALRAEDDRQREALNHTIAALQQHIARLEALERLHAEGAGLHAGVKAIRRAVERGQLRGLPGTVAELIHVPPHLERAIEIALGGRIQHWIAQRWEDAEAAITWLKNHRAGRATFLPLDSLRPPRPLDLQPRPGTLGVAADLVSCDPAYRPVVTMLLGRTVVVEDLTAARALFRQLRGSFQIVTLTGEIVRSGGAVTGGTARRERQGHGLLARERERRELPAQIATLESKAASLRAERDTLRARHRHLARQLDTLLERQRELHDRHRRAEAEAAQAARDLEQLEREIAWQHTLAREVAQEREAVRADLRRLDADDETLAAELAQAQADVSAAEQALTTTAQQVESSAAQLAELRLTVALREQEHAAQRRLLEARRREADRLARQIAEAEAHIRVLTAELETLAAHLAALQTHYDEARTAADALAAQVPALEAQVAALEETLTHQEADESAARRTLHQAEQRLAQAELEAQRREDRLQALRREIEETPGIVVRDLPTALSAQRPLPLEAIALSTPHLPELPEELEQQIRDLRAQRQHLGPIHTDAQAEYDEVQARYTFLRTQLEDLERASAQLRRIIADLDAMMARRFRATFKRIAGEFARNFETLFDGGRASLKLRGEGDERSIEIIARPPGKRTASLDMLSGGERALTAAALLFAFLRVSPTPFCLLDEVDAMLDEANVGRFCAMLRDLARETQCLIITHNRHTVEVAETIYGIAMREDGTSQVLSLSLEDLPPSPTDAQQE